MIRMRRVSVVDEVMVEVGWMMWVVSGGWWVRGVGVRSREVQRIGLLRDVLAADVFRSLPSMSRFMLCPLLVLGFDMR
jgi:hypothetical protein